MAGRSHPASDQSGFIAGTESPRMAPPIVHGILGVLTVVMVVFALTQVGPCALGYEYVFFAAAAFTVAASVGIAPAPKVAIGIAIVAVVLLAIGVYQLNVLGCGL